MCDKKRSCWALCCPAVVVAQVRRGQANSHQGKGWESFTDAVVRELDARKTGLVFLLWGKPAQVCVTARVAWRPRGPSSSLLSAHGAYLHYGRAPPGILTQFLPMP